MEKQFDKREFCRYNILIPSFSYIIAIILYSIIFLAIEESFKDHKKEYVFVEGRSNPPRFEILSKKPPRIYRYPCTTRIERLLLGPIRLNHQAARIGTELVEPSRREEEEEGGGGGRVEKAVGVYGRPYFSIARYRARRRERNGAERE